MLEVMNPVIVMQRYELKYILCPEQKDFLLGKLKGRMEPDQFGRTTIASLYYATPDDRLIRDSIEASGFKEKIRLRSYGIATETSKVYLEMKRKADGIVYKRRVATTIPEVERFFAGNGDVGADRQFGNEFASFREQYRTLRPACLIACERTAYFEPDGDLRLTIDENPRFRVTDLSLKEWPYGKLLLPEGYSILEIKVQSAIPLWLAAILSAGRIYNTGFSKYGEAYQRQFLQKARG